MRNSVVIGTYLLISVAVAALEAFAYYKGHEVGHSFYIVWAIVSNLLLLFWLNLDAKERAEIYRPYEFGFLVLLVWFPYFPYYLIRTRRLQGALLFLGVLALNYLGYALQWVIYAVR